MRSNLLFILISVFTGFCFYSLNGSGVSIELQKLHREIGNNLIRIKKESPKSQTAVYSVLDKLSKYYSFSKSVISKKKEYKALLKKEIEKSDGLREKSNMLEAKVEKMSGVMRAVSDKIQKDYVKVDEINIARASLDKERDSFLKEKERLTKENQKLTRERDALIQERETLLRDQDVSPENSEPNKEAVRGRGDVQGRRPRNYVENKIPVTKV